MYNFWVYVNCCLKFTFHVFHIFHIYLAIKLTAFVTTSAFTRFTLPAFEPHPRTNVGTLVRCQVSTSVALIVNPVFGRVWRVWGDNSHVVVVTIYSIQNLITVRGWGRLGEFGRYYFGFFFSAFKFIEWW